MKKNFKLSYSLQETSIITTSEPVDNIEVFRTFPQAKKALLRFFTLRVKQWNEGKQFARKLKVSDVV